MSTNILLNMGGARNKEELKEFLYNMFKDKRIISSPIRHILAPIISNTRYKKVWKNYEKINGSRIYKITENLAKKIESLTKEKTLYAFKYTSPTLKEYSNFDKVNIIILYPHFSFTTYQSSLDDLKYLNSKEIYITEPFYKEKEFNQIIVDDIKKSIKNEKKKYHLIFSAHGIPEKFIKRGDIYYENILEHIEILKQYLKNDFQSINLAFQSRFGFSKWLSPYLEDSLKQFKNENVIIYPISFTIDNSETDYELKIEYKEIAKKIGIKNYKVIECVNDKTEFAKFLISLKEKARIIK